MLVAWLYHQKPPDLQNICRILKFFQPAKYAGGAGGAKYICSEYLAGNGNPSPDN